MSSSLPLFNVETETYFKTTYGSIENLIKRAKDGELEAQIDLGSAYAEGIENFVEQDSEKAIGWLSSAIDNGSGCLLPSIFVSLGKLYDLKGSVVYQRKAYELYHQGAELGCVEAQLNLAEMYRCGVEGVVNEDLKEAFEWYKKAADEDYDEANLYTANMRKIEEVVSNNSLMALKRLFKYYSEGDCPEGVPQQSKAVYYLTTAAERGDTEAQMELGKIFMTGSYDQPKNMSKARRWLTKAAEKGELSAQKLLTELPEKKTMEELNFNPSTEAMKQSCDIMKEKMKLRAEANFHPYYTFKPFAFTDALLEHFDSSPTARRFLKSFKLIQRALDILHNSDFSDERGVSLLAQGILTESLILQSFPVPYDKIIQFCEKTLSEKPTFFEGLFLSCALSGTEGKFANSEGDLKNICCLKNLIGFIRKAEPGTPLSKNPVEFSKNYSSWLHALYYCLGSAYVVTDDYEHAAEAFENSIKCCPANIDSKRGLGCALMYTSFGKSSARKEHIKEKFPTTKYENWSAEELKTAAVKVLKQYLSEAAGCERFYPNACYYLAYIAFSSGNLKELRKYYELGQDAEEKRLPFLNPVDLPLKDMLSPIYQMLSAT